MSSIPQMEEPDFFFPPSVHLATPRDVQRSVQRLFRYHGADFPSSFPPLPYLHLAGTAVGLALGLGDAGRLYGPVGGLIGASLGYCAARAGTLVLDRLVLARLSLPAAIHRAILRGDYPQALVLAERLLTLKVERDPARLAVSKWWRCWIWGRDLVFGQNYPLPLAVQAANLLALMGILHEALGQPQAALLRYQRALKFCPDHSFVVYLSLGLMERHPDLVYDRVWLLQSLTHVQRQRHNYARIIFLLYQPLLLRLFPELFRPEAVFADSVSSPSFPPPAAPEPPAAIKADAGVPLHFSNALLRVVAGPGETLTDGFLVLEGERVAVARLAPMMFQFVSYLAKIRSQAQHMPAAEGAEGWVSISELQEMLAGLQLPSTAEAIVRMAAKLKVQMEEAGISPALLEQNPSGSFRLAIPPAQIVLEPNPFAKI